MNTPATISAALARFTLLLQNLYAKEEAESITRFAFEEILQLSPIDLKLKKENELSHEQNKHLENVLQRLLRHEPLQYILGIAYFYDLKLCVNESVLIPRRETEELVELILAQNPSFGGKIIDIGTGSGCIAIALRKHLPQSSVYAIDASENAVRMARLNARNLLNTDKENKFLQHDIFDRHWWAELGKLDIIVSNPPYVTENEKAQMQPNVLDYEPATALFVQDSEPLKYYDAIAEFAIENLNPSGKLYFEINEKFGSETRQMLTDKGFGYAEIKKDMQGKDRFAIAGFTKQ